MADISETIKDLTKKDAERLDDILREALKKGRVTSNKLPLFDEPGKKMNPGQTFNLKCTQYSFYLEIFESYGIAKVDHTINYFSITPIIPKTSNFINKGGFRKLLDDNLANESLKLEKLRSEVKLTKLKVKTFWPLFFLAVFGGMYSVYDLIDRIGFQGKESTVDEVRKAKGSDSILSTDNEKQVQPIDSDLNN